jgi:hypothetical protein
MAEMLSTILQFLLERAGFKAPLFLTGFTRNESLLYELAFRTAQAFEDFRHIYYGYLKEVAFAG